MPFANAGTWYVLAYAEALGEAPPSGYAVQASSGEVLVTSVSPTVGVDDCATTLTIHGAGFRAGSAVSLVDSLGNSYLATGTSAPSSVN